MEHQCRPSSMDAPLMLFEDSTRTRQVALAERAGVTKQAIGPVVRELEQLGYVRTGPDPADHRAKLVSLTEGDATRNSGDP
jgi:DNA-binding MarR family transcriptional regulator